VLTEAPIVGIECEHDRDDSLAVEMLQALSSAYPGHSWFVKITGGIVHVKNLDFSDKWGMALHYSQVKADASERRRELVRAGGEFLERAHLARGQKTERHTQIEGIPDKHLGRVGL
jgi:hypothetical protein